MERETCPDAAVTRPQASLLTRVMEEVRRGVVFWCSELELGERGRADHVASLPQFAVVPVAALKPELAENRLPALAVLGPERAEPFDY
jgi:hypothetical protein